MYSFEGENWPGTITKKWSPMARFPTLPTPSLIRKSCDGEFIGSARIGCGTELYYRRMFGLGQSSAACGEPPPTSGGTVRLSGMRSLSRALATDRKSVV